jgi:hypothetical protein
MTARYTVFEDHKFLVNGPQGAAVREINTRLQAGSTASILSFDDETGRQIDLDLRGVDAAGETTPAGRGKGRPKLGVISREVTLLPRHWEWLRAQPGGASAALRKLVDQARHFDRGADDAQRAQNAAYAFLSAIAGNLPGFEELSRALFARDEERFGELMAEWPGDIRRYAGVLAAAAFVDTSRCLEKDGA